MKRILFVLLLLSLAILAIEVRSIIFGSQTNNDDNTAGELLISNLVISGINNSEITVRDSYVKIGRSEVPQRLFNLIQGKCLIYRFSGAECNVCIEHVIASLRNTFPDYESNDRILLIGSNLNRRVLKGYYGRNILYLQGERLGLPAEEYNMPCLFILDERGISKLAFIPEKSYPGMTLAYLADIRSRYFK